MSGNCEGCGSNPCNCDLAVWFNGQIDTIESLRATIKEQSKEIKRLRKALDKILGLADIYSEKQTAIAEAALRGEWE